MADDATVLRQVHRLFGAGTIAGLTEDQLLERFLADRDEAAFTAIVDRHGPMVWAVCRRLIHEEHDAEDAFQAVFLVLVRKAGHLRDRQALGPWLHGVAIRVAARARSVTARRRGREQTGLDPNTVPRLDRSPGQVELREVLDQEIQRLPHALRRPIVLCHLEGRTQEEAATALKWTPGTVRGRLNRGRERLRAQLARRGIAPAAVLAITEGAPWAEAGACVPPELVAATARAAASGAFPETVRSLAHRLTSSQLLARAATLAGGTLALGAALVAASNGPPSNPPAATPPPTAAQPHEPTPRKAAPAPRPSGRDDLEIHAITVTGRALDPDGRPVAGAVIRLTDANSQRIGGAPLLLRDVVTGPDGRYVLRDVPLPVWKADLGPLKKPVEGKFEVSGTADGFGFTWDTVRSYRPGPPPDEKPHDRDTVYYDKDPIAVDLHFGPPARLHGRLIDDRGRPVARAKIQVAVIDDPRGHGKITWHCTALAPDGGEPRGYSGVAALPEAFRSTLTDVNGEYHLDGLPREALLLVQLDADPAVAPKSLTIATSQRHADGAQSLGYDGTLNHTFTWWRSMHIRLVAAGKFGDAITDTDINVTARGDRLQRDGATGTRKAHGIVRTLRLPPGRYTLVVQPASSVPWLPAEKEVTVARQPPEQRFQIALEPAARVALKAVDADTGAPIAGVGFGYDTDARPERRELQSSPSFVDHPVTGPDGCVRAVIVPERCRFFATAVPDPYELVPSAHSWLECTPETETTVEFRLQRNAATKPAFMGPEPERLERLNTLWLAQERSCRRVRFTAREVWQPAEALAPDALRAFLDDLDPDAAVDVARLIAERFPGAPAAASQRHDVTVDGRRCREHAERPAESAAGGQSVTISNGVAQACYESVNNQANIMGSRMHLRTWTLADFAHTTPIHPHSTPIPAAGWEVSTVRTQQAGKWTTIDWRIGRTEKHTVVDEATGFVARDSTGTDNVHASWQFGPRTYSNGVTLPQVSVEMSAARGKINALWIRTLESVDFNPPIRPETFILAVPPGTLIMDYRTRGSAPAGVRNDTYRGVTTGPVLDLLAYADALAARRQSPPPPRLKTGDVAPALRPAAWIDGHAPELQGKVVLIDFWGISCGPCVAALPDVRDAARQFAGKDLVVIGLHDSSGTVEQVAEFARKRHLNYPLAIDRPLPKDASGFGATFEDYGVRAIPTALVLDPQGRVAFVGRFEDALARAAILLDNEKPRDRKDATTP